MGKRPTIADLAEAANVSVATVDRVLNRRLPVREETAMRVIAAAERIGFHATGLLRQRLHEVPALTFGFLLQKSREHFYRAFGAGLSEATRTAANVRGRAIVEFSEELVPAVIAERLRDLAVRCDAVALVSLDHPTVNQAIEDVSAAGKPVFALLSDVTAPSRAGCLMVDRHKSGRIAAWTIARLSRRPGTIGMLIGSHRYLSQEVAEMSFRSYMREHAPEFRLLEPVISLDDSQIAHAAVIELLADNPDLVGIVHSGGGPHGLVSALREEGAGRRIVSVCNELTPVTRQALVDGVIDLVLDTPIARLAREAVDLMVRAATAAAPATGIVQVQLSPDIFMSENV